MKLRFGGEPYKLYMEAEYVVKSGIICTCIALRYKPALIATWLSVCLACERNPGRFGPGSFRPGRFGLGRFGQFFRTCRFGLGRGSFRPIFGASHYSPWSFRPKSIRTTKALTDGRLVCGQYFLINPK